MSVARYRRTLLESGMEAAVAELVTRKGGRLFHVRRADVAPELVDLPDWLIVAPHLGTVILAEAKSVKRELTAGQRAVLELCRECHRFEPFIVRSTEPRDGEISYDTFLTYLAGDESELRFQARE